MKRNNPNTMNTLKPVDEFVYDCMEDGVYDREDILKLDRTHTKEVLIEGLLKKHTREMQPGENRAKYLAFKRGEEHMRKKAIQLVENTLNS